MQGWFGLKRLCRIGMLCVCLTMSSACSRQVQIVRIGPPEALTTAVVIPEWEGRTNGDLFRYAIKLRQCADRANIQLKAVREWAKDGLQNR